MAVFVLTSSAKYLFQEIKMNFKTLLTAASIVFSLSLGASQALAHAEHGQPQHGGIHAEAGEAQFEIVARDGKLTVYVTSHGAPVDTVGASGRLTVLAGTVKSDIALAPAGSNLLQGVGPVASGAKLLINVQLPGKKALQARAVMQ